MSHYKPEERLGLANPPWLVSVFPVICIQCRHGSCVNTCNGDGDPGVKRSIVDRGRYPERRGRQRGAWTWWREGFRFVARRELKDGGVRQRELESGRRHFAQNWGCWSNLIRRWLLRNFDTRCTKFGYLKVELGHATSIDAVSMVSGEFENGHEGADGEERPLLQKTECVGEKGRSCLFLLGL
jgi:hypothetical protein